MRRPTNLDRELDVTKIQNISLTLNPIQKEIVNRLLKGGLHGNTPAEVVRRLFCDGCQPHALPPKPE